MDNTERFIRKELVDNKLDSDLDVDSILSGIHHKIRIRKYQKRVLHSSPVVLLLVFIMLVLLPADNGVTQLPGAELLIVGWEDSWTEIQIFDSHDSDEQALYERSVDYLIDDQYFAYDESIDDLLDIEDLEAFIGYLKEV